MSLSDEETEARRTCSDRRISFRLRKFSSVALAGLIIYSIRADFRAGQMMEMMSIIQLSGTMIGFQGLVSQPWSNSTQIIGGDGDNKIKRVKFLKELTSQFSDKTAPSWTIFYNVFIPTDNGDGTENALRIVREQIQQVLTSHRAALNATRIPVVFVTIGLANILTPDKLSELCPYPLDCRLAEHLEQGSEADTLRYITDHCQQFTADRGRQQLVTYLHNKGSFTRQGYNELWRPALTMAAVSELCLEHIEHGYCNACGLNFYMQWMPFFPGNMFSGECSYLGQLMEIDAYAKRLAELAGEVMVMRVQQELVTMRLDQEFVDFYGLGRYYAEQWVGSHPDLVPCDVGPESNYRYSHAPTTESQLQWALSPRSPEFRLPLKYSHHTREQFMQDHRDIRLREFFGSAGQMLRWLYVYGRAPSNDSWAWTVYDDGKLWHDAYVEYGVDAVKIITSEWSLAGNQPAFRDYPSGLDEGLLDLESKHAVFFKAHVPVDLDPSAFQLELELIKEQLSLLSSFSSVDDKALIAIDLSGHSLLNVSVMCADKATLECRHMGHLGNEVYQGETLQRLHNYCRTRPAARVTYLSNHLTPQHVAANAGVSEIHEQIMEITTALTRPSCRNKHAAANETMKCNVCGSAIHPLPYIHMAGNMWTAECEYINKLVSPEKFAGKIRNFLVQALPMRLLDRLTSGIFSDSMEVLGIEGYAMDHWIGSHPSMVPCEWANASRWNKGTFTGAALSGWGFDLAKHNTVMNDGNLRLKEFSFLAGLCVKWHMLYGQLPPADSWVYQAFPDGEHWQREGPTCVEQYVAQ